MEHKEEYYLYSLFAINLIGIMYYFFKLTPNGMIFESLIIFLATISPIFLIYSFEKEIKKPYMYTLVFFAVMSVNSALIYILTRSIDSAFLGLLNVFGIFLTVMMIPIKRISKAKSPKKMINPEFRKGIAPLKEVSDASVSSERKKPEYLIQELERELEKVEKRHLQDQKKSEMIRSFDEEKSILDDPDVIDESEIVIEEIKPTKEPDLHPLKKSKRHDAKKGIKEITKLIDEIEKAEEEEYDKNDPYADSEVIIEEIRPTVEKDLKPLKKVRKVSKLKKKNSKKKRR
jgi:hypothetical protein